MKSNIAGYKEGIGSKLFDICIFFILLFVLVICLYPFLYVFSVSVSDSSSVASGLVKLYPIGFNTYAYTSVFGDPEIIRGYANSILYAGSATGLALVLTCMAAYPLSLKRFYGRNVISIYFSITLLFGSLGSGLLIPNFLLTQNLGIMDTMWSIVLPAILNAWYIVIVRTNFQAIPEELHESASIDGAGNWRVLFQVILPLSKPILATIALFTLVSQWNDFFRPLLYLNSPEKFPLQLILRKLLILGEMRGTNLENQAANLLNGGKGNLLGFYESYKAATIMVSIIPILLVYPFIQKYLVKGALIGSVKG